MGHHMMSTALECFPFFLIVHYAACPSCRLIIKHVLSVSLNYSVFSSEETHELAFKKLYFSLVQETRLFSTGLMLCASVPRLLPRAELTHSKLAGNLCSPQKQLNILRFKVLSHIRGTTLILGVQLRIIAEQYNPASQSSAVFHLPLRKSC